MRWPARRGRKVTSTLGLGEGRRVPARESHGKRAVKSLAVEKVVVSNWSALLRHRPGAIGATVRGPQLGAKWTEKPVEETPYYAASIKDWTATDANRQTRRREHAVASKAERTRRRNEVESRARQEASQDALRAEQQRLADARKREMTKLLNDREAEKAERRAMQLAYERTEQRRRERRGDE